MEILLFIFSTTLAILVFFNTRISIELNIDYKIRSIKKTNYWFNSFEREKIFLNFSMNLAIISLLLSPAYFFIQGFDLRLFFTVITLLNIPNLIFYFDKYREYQKIKAKNKNKISFSRVYHSIYNCDEMFINKICILHKTKCKNLACLMNVFVMSTLLIGFIVVQTIAKQTELKKINELHYAWNFAPQTGAFFIWIF